MKLEFRELFLLGWVLFFAPITLWAAREGLIGVDDASIYDAPSRSAQAIGKLNKGSPIAASNYPIAGFHKIRTATGLLGWAPVESLLLKPVPSEDEIEKAIRSLGINADGYSQPPPPPPEAAAAFAPAAPTGNVAVSSLPPQAVGSPPPIPENINPLPQAVGSPPPIPENINPPPQAVGSPPPIPENVNPPPPPTSSAGPDSGNPPPLPATNTASVTPANSSVLAMQSWPKKKEPSELFNTLSLRALLNLNFFAISDAITNYTISDGYGMGAEVLLRTGSSVAMVFRAETIAKNSSLTFSNLDQTFEVDVSSLPMMVGLEFQLADTKGFSLGLALLGGIAFNTQLTSTDTSVSATSGNTVSFTSSPLVALVELVPHYKFNNYISFFAELGYRVMQAVSVNNTDPTAALGSEILNSTFSTSFAGPVAGFGLSLNF